MTREQFADNTAIPRILEYFYDIFTLRHGGDACLGDAIAGFAERQDFFIQKDAAGSLLVKKPASPGCKGAPRVILTSRLGGGAAYAVGGPAELVREGGRIRALRAPLDAQRNLGIAFMLTLMEAEDIVHPALELVFEADGASVYGFTELLRGRSALILDYPPHSAQGEELRKGAAISRVLYPLCPQNSPARAAHAWIGSLPETECAAAGTPAHDAGSPGEAFEIGGAEQAWHRLQSYLFAAGRGLCCL